MIGSNLPRRSPQHLAWTVLVASFLTCCALAVGVPAAALSFVNNSTYSATISVKLQAGRTAAFEPPATEADARVVGQEGRLLEEGSTVIVDDDGLSQALLAISPGEDVTETLVLAQLYAGARVVIERARVPRFNFTTSPVDIILRIVSGRVQVQNHHLEERNLKLTVLSSHMSAQLTRGAYSFEISADETRLFVSEGAAQVTAMAKPETFNIEANQRTIVRKGEGIAPGSLAPPRDLIRNGRFQAPLDQDWHAFSEVYVPGDLTGTVRILGQGADTSLLFDRPGKGLNWGRTSIEQFLTESVNGRRSVQLRLVFTILYQELKVCGGQGSECPLMVKISYRNQQGADSDWTQGFYADGTPTMPDLPDFIVQAASPRTKHIATRLGVQETYESPNLLDVIRDMQQINSIQLYAEGHGVQTQIYEVELLVLD